VLCPCIACTLSAKDHLVNLTVLMDPLTGTLSSLTGVHRRRGAVWPLGLRSKLCNLPPIHVAKVMVGRSELRRFAPLLFALHHPQVGYSIYVSSFGILFWGFVFHYPEQFISEFFSFLPRIMYDYCHPLTSVFFFCNANYRSLLSCISPSDKYSTSCTLILP